MEHDEFRAMGTDVEVLLDAASSGSASNAFVAAREKFARLESLLSRFRPDSELSALNRTGRLRVAPDLLRVTQLALEARERTGGRFDPTVHDALVAAGYDRSFEEIEAGGDRVAGTAAGPLCGRRAGRPRTSEILLGPGVRLDFGGIAKGYAVDRACDLLAERWSVPRERGGDLAVRAAPGPSAWRRATAPSRSS